MSFRRSNIYQLRSVFNRQSNDNTITSLLSLEGSAPARSRVRLPLRPDFILNELFSKRLTFSYPVTKYLRFRDDNTSVVTVPSFCSCNYFRYNLPGPYLLGGTKGPGCNLPILPAVRTIFMAIANPGGMNATAPSILTLEFIGVAFGQVESFSTVLWKEGKDRG